MNACNQVLHALLIFSHPFWATFHVLTLGFFSVGQGVVSHPDLGHIVNISGVHQQLLLILILLPLFIVHSIHMSQAMLE